MVTGIRARMAGRGAAYLVLALGAVVFLLPFAWMVSTSLKSNAGALQYPPRFLPDGYHWGSFAAAWQALPFGTFLMNSVVITVLSVAGSVAFSTVSAYAFARLRARWRTAMFALLLGTMMIPGEIIIVPDFILFNHLRLVNTIWPIVWPYWFGNAFFVFLLRQFMLTIPRELDEAAHIDGAGHLRILFRVIVPQMKPAIATVTVFAFVGSWNNFIYPLIYLRDQSKYTMSLGLQLFASAQYITRYNQMMAIGLLMLAPVVVVFLIAQRSFVRGITLTGLGGR
ncbi:MAG: carbohydrate ABC transporter permease [Nocardiopsaceae bacterium]|nr:carbohydrate ABC transporter permease [Nocardiopsaceae bacterium]